MIKEIKIENFKSIESLNLELGRLNVFIGANGSGKSNILEGIAFIQAAKENKLDTEFLYARGVRVEDNIYTPSLFEQNNSDPITITTSQNEHPINVLHINKDSWGMINLGDSDVTSLFNDNTKTTLHKFNTNGQSSILTFVIFAPENTYLRNFAEEGQIKPLGVRGEGLFKLLQKIIQEKPKYFTEINEYIQLIDWVEGMEMPNDLMFGERRLLFKDLNLAEGLQFINQRSANEGTLYLLFYLTLFISEDTPKFFAIDNIDNAMNPKLGSELIRILSKLAKEHDKQVILTTHNPSILDGLDLSDDEQRLFVISRNKSGHTQAIRVPHRESDERLSTRFIRGSIGGLPKNF